MKPECPLCGNSGPFLLEVIRTEDLIELYDRTVRVDVSTEFHGLDHLQYYRCEVCDLAFFFPMVAGSGQFYTRMQRLPWYYLDEKAEFQFARTFLKESDHVLDIGCGKGAFATGSSAKKYTCLELSHEAAELARSCGIRVLTESIQKHALANPSTYDVVCGFQVLEHVAELRSFIESSLMCLKPYGLLIYSTPSADSFARYIPNLTTDLPPHHLTRWSDQALRSIARYFPVQIITLWHEPLDPIHKEFYASAILQKAVMKTFRRGITIVDPSFTTKTIATLSQYIAKPLVGSLTGGKSQPDGLSVVCVYRKAQ